MYGGRNWWLTPLPAEEVKNTPRFVDQCVVHDKRHFATTKLAVPPHKCPHACLERSRSEGAVAELEVLDPVGGDDHQQRQVPLSVGRDRLDGGLATLGPGSERGRVEDEPALVEEPELLIQDPVDDDGVVVALLEALVREDNASPRSCLLVRQALVIGNS